MKYPQLVHMPRHVEDWLERELEARGIDGVAYTRYIVSLLQQDSLDEPYDLFTCLPVTRAKGICKSRKRGRCQSDSWHSWHGWQEWGGSWDSEGLKRLAAVRCLMSASDEKCDIETLVDELCAKLKEIRNGNQREVVSNAAQQHSSSSCSNLSSPEDPALRYYTAFPALKHSAVSQEPVTHVTAWGRNLVELHEEPVTTMEDDSLPLDTLELGLELELARPQLRDDVEDRANLECLIAKFDMSVQQIWSGEAVEESKKTNVWSPPSVALYSNWSQLEQQEGGVWGVDAMLHTLCNMKKWSVGKDVEVESALWPEPLPEPEEDLLTSARTHFRPIRAEEHQPAQTTLYADGTTFAICNETEDVKFRRSDSGSLYLETDVELEAPRKYMEYKDNTEEEMEEFVPKFRLRQSNEKCVQTEEMDDVASISDVCSLSSASDPPDAADEFFFPGDDELAQNIINSLDEAAIDPECNYKELYTAGRGAWDAYSTCHGHGGNRRDADATYRRMKDELTEDGEQLLSDLSCLTQMYSLYDDDSTTASSGALSCEAVENLRNERLRELWGDTDPQAPGRRALIT